MYVLEDWGAATWATGYRAVESMRPAPDEETVCVTMNSWSPPQTIIHAPGDGRAWQAEFGEETGEGPALDTALHAADAVFPSIGETGEAAAAAYYEEHGPRLPVAVFTAVGNYCGPYAAADMRSLGANRSGTYPTPGGRAATVPRVGRDRPTAIRSSVDFPIRSRLRMPRPHRPGPPRPRLSGSNRHGHSACSLIEDVTTDLLRPA